MNKYIKDFIKTIYNAIFNNHLIYFLGAISIIGFSIGNIISTLYIGTFIEMVIHIFILSFGIAIFTYNYKSEITKKNDIK